MRRVIAYIDGFNLYFGLRAKGWRRCYWIDVHRLAERLLRPDQTLAGVRYFTARVSGSRDPGEPKRQATYLEALETLRGVTIHYGHYLVKPRRCRACGTRWDSHEEKMTDVNLAVALLDDAYDDRFDTALIVSADSDLLAPIAAVRRRFEGKRVVVAFPPARSSAALRDVAHASFTIGRAVLRGSRLPETVVKADGYLLRRPANWT